MKSMNNEQIRPLVLGIVWHNRYDDKLLVCADLVDEYYDHVKNETFYRPLGGGIKFGEHSQEALRREFREELDVELASARYLATTENIFTCNGERGHEIVLLYEATLANQSLYEREAFELVTAHLLEKAGKRRVACEAAFAAIDRADEWLTQELDTFNGVGASPQKGGIS